MQYNTINHITYTLVTIQSHWLQYNPLLSQKKCWESPCCSSCLLKCLTTLLEQPVTVLRYCCLGLGAVYICCVHLVYRYSHRYSTFISNLKCTTLRAILIHTKLNHLKTLIMFATIHGNIQLPVFNYSQQTNNRCSNINLTIKSFLRVVLSETRHKKLE